MKRFQLLFWDDWNVEHIGKHGIILEEVEEVAFSSGRRIRRGRQTSLYYLFGQTYSGRYLLLLFGIYLTAAQNQ